jgi:hypothetical protein
VNIVLGSVLSCSAVGKRQRTQAEAAGRLTEQRVTVFGGVAL